MYLFIKNLQNKKLPGFSLVELVVSMAVIVSLAAYLYGSYPRMDRFLTYTTGVNDFASQIKEVQTYGASRGGTTVKGDGVYLRQASSSNYYLYNDMINSTSSATGIGLSNSLWDGTTTEPLTTKTFLNRITLLNICRNATSSPNGDPLDNFVCDQPEMSIAFQRPRLSATLSNPQSGTTSPVLFARVCLEFDQTGVRDQDKQRSVKIESNGQIQVLKTLCPR